MFLISTSGAISCKQRQKVALRRGVGTPSANDHGARLTNQFSEREEEK